MPEEKKRLNLIGAVSDLLIFVLLVGGAGFFGYFIGINQKLAPVQVVAPGTLEAIASLKELAGGKKKETVSTVKKEAKVKAPEKTLPKQEPAKKPSAKKEKPKKKALNKVDVKNLKYWIASVGDQYIGSSVKVLVNGRPVDIFFSPGKLVNITDHIHKGNNQIRFEANVLADEYNQHLGNNKYALTLNIVSGKTVSEDYNREAVLVSYKRTGADIENDTTTLGFKAK